MRSNLTGRRDFLGTMTALVAGLPALTASWPSVAEAAAAGAISGGDMTVEAAIAKLMIGLGRFPGDSPELRAFLERDVVVERATMLGAK